MTPKASIKFFFTGFIGYVLIITSLFFFNSDNIIILPSLIIAGVVLVIIQHFINQIIISKVIMTPKEAINIVKDGLRRPIDINTSMALYTLEKLALKACHPLALCCKPTVVECAEFDPANGRCRLTYNSLE